MPHPTHHGMTVVPSPALGTPPTDPDAPPTDPDAPPTDPDAPLDHLRVGARRPPAIIERPELRRVVIVDSPVPSYSAEAPSSTETPSQILATHLSERGTRVDVLTWLDVHYEDPPRTQPGRLPPSQRSPQPVPHTAEPHVLDLVVGFSDPDGDARAAARLAQHTSAPLLVILCGLDRFAPPHVVHALRRADQMTVPSDSFRQTLTSLGVDDARITVLPPWPQSSPSWLDRSDARRRLGWPERAFIMVHSGPMSRGSGLEAVVESAAFLGPSDYVAVTGSGPLRPVIEARAAQLPNVLVPPPMDAGQRALTHVAADVLVVTEPASSPHLTLPLELARCLSAGRPVIATAPAAGTLATELAQVSEAGLIVPPGEPARLAEVLLALRADPSHRVAMGLAAIAYAESQLSLDTVLSRLDLVVDAVLAADPITI